MEKILHHILCNFTGKGARTLDVENDISSSYYHSLAVVFRSHVITLVLQLWWGVSFGTLLFHHFEELLQLVLSLIARGPHLWLCFHLLHHQILYLVSGSVFFMFWKILIEEQCSIVHLFHAASNIDKQSFL